MKLEFANFTCKFGPDKNLIDFVEPIVLPAFFDTSLVRTYGPSSYLIYSRKIINLGTVEAPVPALFGEFVKDTILTAEQRLDDDEGLVKDYSEMQSSPSAIFLLIFNNHRLLYLHKTKFSPELSAFQATMSNFLTKKRNQYIDNTYYELKRTQNKHTWKSIKEHLMEIIPPPSIKILPLSSQASLEEFVGQYRVLKRVTFVLSDLNNELDLSEMFNQMRAAKDRSHSTTSQFIHNNPEGLSKTEAITQMQPIVEAGTCVVRMSGTDASGGKLTGSNDKFNLRVELPLTGEEDEDGIARLMHGKYNGLIESNTLKPPTTEEPPKEKLTRLVSYSTDGQHDDE